MNTFEFYRQLEKITIDVVREIGVQSVQKNESVVVSDAIVANIEGLTFAGNKIDEFPPFTDWEETGEFHDNLKFYDSKDIEFTSKGDGYKSISTIFPFDDTIAPTAKILDQSTLLDIKKSFIQILQAKL